MQPDDIWVSIVVDTVDDHLYQADLLIRTLDRHASIPPGQVIVHYVNRLPAAAVATFARMGCMPRKIEPFLDGKHCNKLQQLSVVDEFIRPFSYSDTVMSEILQFLGAGDLECGVERHNESLHRQGLEMMRIVNRYHLAPGIREMILSRIREIEAVFGEQLESYRPSAELAGSNRRLTEENQLLLRNGAG